MSRPAKKEVIKAEPIAKGPETFYNKKHDLPKDKDSVCVILEKIEFNAETGKKLSVPQLYTTNSRQWVTFLKHHKSHGFTIIKVLKTAENMQEFNHEDYYDEFEIERIKGILS